MKKTLKYLTSSWSSHRGPTMSAAIAYKAILSIIPLFIIFMAIANIFFGSDSYLSNQILELLSNIIGENAAYAIKELAVTQSYNTHLNIAIFGAVFVLYSASSVLLELVLSLDTIWDVRHDQNGFYYFKRRMMAMLIVLAMGSALIAIKFFDVAIDTFRGFDIFDIPSSFEWLKIIFKYLSFPLLILIFSFIFKTLPNINIKWRDVWLASLVTALFFSLGQWGLRLYFQYSTFSSLYGAASTIIVFMLWAYYSTMIILMGAELAKMYTFNRGSKKLSGNLTNKNQGSL